MLIGQVSVVVKPWYGQFYLQRGNASWASDRVSDIGYETRLEAAEIFVYVGTSMYGHPTAVRMEVHDHEPGLSESADQVVEVGLGGVGGVAVLNWGDDTPVAKIEVPDGPCRLRGSWFEIAAAQAHPDNDLGGGELSPENLLIQVWPSTETTRHVLREWPH